MQDDTRILNEKLRYQRKMRGWSQRRLADLLDTSKEMIGRWERGVQQPSPYYQEKLCVLFEKTAAELGFMQTLPGQGDITEKLPIIVQQGSERIEQSPDDVETDLLLQTSFSSQTEGIDVLSLLNKETASPFLELQEKLRQDMQSLSQTSTATRQLFTRRDALLTIAVLAMPIFTSSHNYIARDNVEEVLSSFAISIQACWQLSKEDDIFTIHSALSTYIPLLVSLTEQLSSSYKKRAAHLSAQAFLLFAIMQRHIANFQAAEDACKKAVRYSNIAGDPTLHLTTLRHLAMIYYYAKRYTHNLDLYYQMLSFLSTQTISPLLQSFIQIGIAGSQAMNGLADDAQKSLALAKEAFFRQEPSDDCPIYIDYDYSQLFISEGLMYYNLGYYKDALNTFLQVDGSAPKIAVAERGRLEFLNNQALTILRLPHRDREMQQCIDYWTAGIQGAIRLKSRQRFNEACQIFDIMTFVWPQEKRVRELRDFIEQGF